MEPDRGISGESILPIQITNPAADYALLPPGTEVHPCHSCQWVHSYIPPSPIEHDFFRAIAVVTRVTTSASIRDWGRRRPCGLSGRRFMARNWFPCQGFGAFRCQGARENRANGEDFDTDRENCECQTFFDSRPVPEKTWRTLFLFLAGGALTDNDVDRSGRGRGGSRRRTCTPLVAVLDFSQNGRPSPFHSKKSPISLQGPQIRFADLIC